ncbi:MAG TPA: PD-(D/E)XK nuclease family protein, partial [Planctomycetota bacterium]|nr:PD-(D/E)XK nuclease family protein [Planctomycetota bacterium]
APFPGVEHAVALAVARRPFTFIVPNRPALEHVKNEVARVAGAVDPFRFFTILGLAKRLLGERAPRVASPRERDLVLERALVALPHGSPVAAELARAGRFRGFRRALLHVFSEIEALGIGPRELASRLERAANTPYGRSVHARIVEAFTAFRDGLGRAELVTEADLLDRATRLVRREKPRFDTVIIDGFVDLAPRQLDLVVAVAEGAADAEIHEVEGSSDELRAALVGRGFAPVAPSAPPSSRAPAIQHVVDGVFGSVEPRTTTDGAVSFLRAGSPADEALSVLKIARVAVLERGRAWNDILVVVPDARAARPELERAARELSVPIRVHAPLPLALHASVRPALAFVRAAATHDVAALLSAAAAPSVGLAPADAEPVAREVRRRAAATPEALAAILPLVANRARAFLRSVLDLGLALASAADAGAALRAIRRALEARLHGPILSELSLAPDPVALELAADEVAALKALQDLLAELERLLAGEVTTPRDLLARIEAEAGETEYTPRDRRRHVVHVVSAADARSWRTPVAIVAGLEEARFPRPWRSDLLLDEDARRALGLVTGEEHALRERQLFRHAISCARDELHVVHAAFSATGEPVQASPFVAAVERLFANDAVTGSQRRRAPSDMVPQSVAEVTTLAGARRFAFLRAAARFRPGSAQEKLARQGVALLERLIESDAENALARRALTRPSWRLTQPQVSALEHSYSASELETFAACPYKHFVQHGLQVRRRDELAVTGLDARLQGKIVHRALERAVSKREDPGAAFDAAFAEVARDLPVGPDEEAFRRSARAAVVRFLAEDDPAFLAKAGLADARAEVAFGRDSAAGPLLIEDPALGGKIQLEGRIDRIDEGPKGAFVTDYKLGKDELDGKTREAMARGEKLQLQVYLLALERVFGKKALGASLVALRSRRRTGIVRPDAREIVEPGTLNAVDLERLLGDAEESIRRIVREIARGRIDAQPRLAKDCRRCEVRDVCRFRERGAS